MKTKATAILVTLLPLITGCLIVLEILSLNRFAGSGKNLQRINTEISLLSSDNILLEERIASYSSLIAVSKRAGELGFVVPTSSSYQTIIPEELPVALKTPQ